MNNDFHRELGSTPAWVCWIKRPKKQSGVLVVEGRCAALDHGISRIDIGIPGGTLIRASLIKPADGRPDAESAFASEVDFRATLEAALPDEQSPRFCVIVSFDDGAKEARVIEAGEPVDRSGSEADLFETILVADSVSPDEAALMVKRLIDAGCSLEDAAGSDPSRIKPLLARMRAATVAKVRERNSEPPFLAATMAFPRWTVTPSAQRAAAQRAAAQRSAVHENALQRLAAKPLEICIVTTDFVGPTYNGGIGTFNTALALLLADAGHRVTVLYDQGSFCEHGEIGDWIRHYASKGVRLVPLTPSGVSMKGSWILKRSHDIQHWLKERKFDWVHFHEMMGTSYYAMTAHRLGLLLPDAVFCIGMHSPSSWHMRHDERFLHSGEHLLIELLERESVRAADVAFAPSEYLLTSLAKLGWAFPSDTFVLPYPLFTGPRQGSRALRRIDELVFFGRLETRKGLKLFCDAIDRIRTHLPEKLRISFVGRPRAVDGVDAETFIAKRSARWGVTIKVETGLDRFEALRFIRRPEVLAVMPSLQDNSPLVVYECIDHEIPFISTAVGGIPEIVDERDHQSVLVEPSASQLGDRLLHVLRHGACPARPSVSMDSLTEQWIDFHHEMKPLSHAAKRRNVKGAQATVAVLTESAQDSTDVLQSLRSQTVRPRAVLLAPRVRDDAGVLRRITEQFGNDFALQILPEHADEAAALNDALSRARTPRLLVVRSRSMLHSDALELLLGAAEGSDAVTCLSDVVVRSAPGAEPQHSSRLLGLGLGSGLGMLSDRIRSEVILFDTARLLAAGGFSERAGDPLWTVLARLEALGGRGMLVPEVLACRRFMPGCDDRLEGSYHEHIAALSEYAAFQPPWARDMLRVVQGMHLKLLRDPGKEPRPTGANDWAAERFKASTVTLLRASEETHFSEISVEREVKCESSGVHFICRTESAGARLLLSHFSAPNEGFICGRIDIAASHTGPVTIHVTRQYRPGETVEEVMPLYVQKGRNDIYFEVPSEHLAGFIAVGLGTANACYELSCLELRHYRLPRRSAMPGTAERSGVQDSGGYSQPVLSEP